MVPDIDYQWLLPSQKDITICFVLPGGSLLVKQTCNHKNEKIKPGSDQTSRSNYELMGS